MLAITSTKGFPIPRFFFVQLSFVEIVDTNCESNMRLLSLVVLLYLVYGSSGEKGKKLHIGVKHRPENCDVRTKNGNVLHMHYTVNIYLFEFSLCSNRGRSVYRIW